MNITIVGGGNVGTQFAVHCSQNNKVKIFTSNPEVFVENIKIVDENDNLYLEGRNIVSTSDEEFAFKDADLIFVTYPAFSMYEIADKIFPYVNNDLKIGLVPGTGGGECAFKKCIEKGAVVFGIQRVPSVARFVEKGKVVRAVGYRDELFLASLPSKYANEIANEVSNIFKMKCTAMPNYLNLTLTPSNPILHTTRLKTIFSDYFEGKTYDKVPLFYEDWNDETSNLLFKCDDEVQNICKTLKEFNLSYVKSLKEHYESDTPEKLTKKIQSIKGFKGLKTPTIELDGKYIPDLNSRYFTADFSYGLIILIEIGKMFNVDTQNMENTMNWYKNISKNNNEFSYKEYGIHNKEDFIDFYSL